MKGLAKALANTKIPTERRESILAELRQMLSLSNDEELTPEMVQQIEAAQVKSENPGLQL